MRATTAAVIGGLLAALTTGCLPSEPIRPEALSTITLEHLDNRFVAIVGYNHTSGWNREQLEAGGLAYNTYPPFDDPTKVSLRSTAPRELFFFNKSPSLTDAAWDFSPVTWGALPAKRLPPIGIIATETTTPMYPVKLARLIDHGQCKYHKPWFYEEGTPAVAKGLFKEVHTNLAGLVTSACIGCEAVEWRYSPTFRKNPGTFPADVEDGFHFMLRAHGPNADLSVYGRYIIRMEFGRIVIRPTRIEPAFSDPTTPIAVAVTRFLNEEVPREVKAALTIPTGQECDSDVCCNIVGTDGLTPGMRGLKNALVEKLLAKGYSAADADARATVLVGGTQYYRGLFGVCWLEPDVRRINVRPDELEFVTTNETDPDDDRMIVIYDLMRGLDGDCSNTPVGPVNAVRLPMFTSQQ